MDAATRSMIVIREKAAGVNTLYFLLSDHLGGTSKTISATGEIVAELRYMAFGETWYENGSTPTDLKYTGQREFAELGLYFYQSRFYDVMAGRFVSADTIIPEPGFPLAWDRYSYTINNPLKFTDQTGHRYEVDGPNDDTFHSHLYRQYFVEKAVKEPMILVFEFEKKEPKCYDSPILKPLKGGVDTYKEERLRELIPFLDRYSDIDDILEAVEFTHNSVRPMYKQLKYPIVSGPIIEFILGFTTQISNDIVSPYYRPPEEIIARGGVAGFEDATSDFLSGIIAPVLGGLGTEGGPIGTLSGYVVGSTAVTKFMENVVWAPINQALFDLVR